MVHGQWLLYNNRLSRIYSIYSHLLYTLFLSAAQQAGILWRMGSGLYSTTTGAVGATVGAGIGGVKWVGGKAYDVGSVVASKVPVPPLPNLPLIGKKKDKSE